jgi:hypothetical protein
MTINVRDNKVLLEVNEGWKSYFSQLYQMNNDDYFYSDYKLYIKGELETIKSKFRSKLHA